MRTLKKFQQHGGTWKHTMKKGIRKASDLYRVKQKWYQSGPLASVGNLL